MRGQADKPALQYTQQLCGVIYVKRGYGALLAATAACAAGGVLLTMTIGAQPSTRSAISQAMLIAAMLGFAVAAALRPKLQSVSAENRGKSGEVGARQRAACNFRNVAANAQALKSLGELRDYLEDPGKYVRYGARMPKGVLLYGPPGTGKTLLARALAGEAGVPFFALSGSDFVEKYVGVGASRVRELFKKARKAGKCVIFIDEIDAMAKRRDENSSDERDQTLNALLSEMSGFYTGDGVVVIAATNRMEMLDPALLRPGRFDRQIEVGLPGRDERLSILELHSQNKPMDAGIDLGALAARTVGFSGASLENLLNEAAIMAAARGGGQIEPADLDGAFYKTVAGEDRPITANAAEKRAIAIHEAGHALAARLLMPENRLDRVSILPAGGGVAGYNLTIPQERALHDAPSLRRQIGVLLAGRAAEQAVLGESAVTSGAANDIARATELASAMVLELGLAGEPAVCGRVLARQFGSTGDGQDRCRRLLDELYGRMTALMAEHAEAISALADALIEAEALDGAAATAILDAALSNESAESA